MDPAGPEHPEPVVPLGTRVLVVEDDPLTQVQLEAALTRAGCQVAACASLREARTRLAGPAPELLFLDVLLPDGSGLDLAAWVSAQPTLRHLPILVLSGLPDDDLVGAALAAGATDLLRKPIEAPLLVHRARFALEAARTSRELAHSRDALAEAQRIAALGSFELDLATGRLRCSPQLTSLLGRAPDDPPRHRDTLLAHVHPTDRPRVTRLLRSGPATTDAAASALGLRLLDDDRRLRHAQLRLVVQPSVDTRPERVVGTLQDVTDRNRERSLLEQLATRDPGTTLLNRAGFRTAVADRLATLGAEQQDAVLLLAVTGLTELRLRLGTRGVEELITAVAERLTRPARTDAGDWPAPLAVARVEDDSLALLCGDVPDDGAALERARAALGRLTDPVLAAGQTVGVRARAGVTLAPPRVLGAEELLTEAAAALAHAHGNADGVAGFRGALDADRRRQAILRQDLGSALAEDGLELHFQPQVAADGTVVGLEALVRWQHPDQGWVPPLRFLPLAEQDGLIDELGDWILRRALATLADLDAREGFTGRVAVNLSAAQLDDPRLGDQVLAALDDHRLAADRLEVELTEQALLGGHAEVAQNLDVLHRAGVRLALDDFGTGHSSLPSLVRLGLDVLKIDGRFTADLDHPHHEAVVAASLALARALGLTVIAEGVETAGQRDRLLAAGCDLVQGYLVGRPMPVAELTTWLADRHRR